MLRTSGFSAAVLAACYGGASAFEVTPVQKVIDLLGKLSNQVAEEGKREAANYDKFSCFCKDQADDKVYVIGRSDSKIEKESAAIEKLEADIAQLDEDVVTAKASVETEEGEAEGTKTTRDEARTTYETARESLASAVKACDSAISSLQASKSDVKAEPGAAAALIQSTQKALALLGFEKALQDPAKYEYRSGDIISTLQKLATTFKAELAEKDAEESSAAHDHNMVEGARSNKVKFLKQEITQKEAISSSKGEDKAEKQKFVDEETTARDADQTFLDELTASCEEKATAWDARSTARAGELTALSEAVASLKGMGNAYSANKKLAGLAAVSRHSATAAAAKEVVAKVTSPRKAVVSLLQLGQSTPAKVAAKLQAHLEKAAQTLKSPSLAKVAAAVTLGAKAGEDHFAKVRDVIKDLITKLEEEATNEATAKSVCDEEMGAAVTSRDEKALEIEKLETNIQESKSQIVALGVDIENLGKEIAETHKALNEITELRSGEKAVNAKTLVDAEGGAEAIIGAISTLKAFYGEAFVQKQPAADRSGMTVGDAPEVETGEYAGKADSAKGIFGLLEIIQSDFERTIEATKTAEEEAETAFTKQTEDMEKLIKDAEDAKTSKEDDKTTKESDLVGFKDDSHDATSLHASTLETLEKLQASCVDTGESWAERKAQRLKEIEALKQAMSILDSWQN